MAERPYSRVYWSIVDDPKFETVYDNDAHMATWLRLLLIADAAYPASAHLPANVRRSSVVHLAEVGLIDLGTGSRFRLHGLASERDMRSQSARNAAAVRWHQPEQSGRNAKPMLNETRRDETRRDEQDARATNDPYADDEGEALTWLAKHGCDVRPGNGYHRQLVTAVQHFGINAVIGKLDRLAEAGTPAGDVKGYVFGAIDALNAENRPSLSVVEAEDREEERRSSYQRRLAATQIRLHDNGAHTDNPSAGCPRCKEVPV